MQLGNKPCQGNCKVAAVDKQPVELIEPRTLNIEENLPSGRLLIVQHVIATGDEKAADAEGSLVLDEHADVGAGQLKAIGGAVLEIRDNAQFNFTGTAAASGGSRLFANGFGHGAELAVRVGGPRPARYNGCKFRRPRSTIGRALNLSSSTDCSAEAARIFTPSVAGSCRFCLGARRRAGHR